MEELYQWVLYYLVMLFLHQIMHRPQLCAACTSASTKACASDLVLKTPFLSAIHKAPFGLFPTTQTLAG
jgi:hypothetical protein